NFRSVSGAAQIEFGHQDNGSDVDDTWYWDLDTRWHYISRSFTTGATISGSNFYIKSTDGGDFYADGLQLETGSKASVYNPGGVLHITAPVSGMASFAGPVVVGSA